MAVTLRGATTASTGASTVLLTYTIANPSWTGSTTPAGDIVLLWATLRGAIAFSTPAGFTAIPAAVISSGQYQLFYRVTDGSEGATFTISWASGGNTSSAMARSYSGADTALVMDPAVPSSSAISGLAAASITTTRDGDMLVWFAATKTSTAGQTPGTITPPSGFTGSTPSAPTSAAADPNVQAYGADKAQGTHGATGTLTGTDSTPAVDTSSGSVVVALAPAAVAATVQRPSPVISRRAPRRAQLGRLGLCAAGIASQIVTPLGSPSAPPHRPVIARQAPGLAQTGPAGRNWGGIAAPFPAPAVTATAYQRPAPRISRPAPHRVVWRGLASQVVTPLGSPSSPLPRPVIQHLPPDRAHAGPAGRPWGGIASAAVTPLGSLQAPRRAVIAPPRNARARLGPAASAGDGVTGPANAAPAAAVSPPRLPPQPRRPPPARGQWRGLASRIVTPLGTAARRPGPQITSRPRARALWRGIAGTIAPAVTAIPKWRPLPSRRGPQRARTGGVLGPANALPPPFTIGSLTASGAPAAVLTAGGAASVLTAATAPSGTLSAATAAGNALELFPVQAEDLGELLDEAGGQIGA